ncbi:MAG: hypothetical protein QM535_16675 [Limnohabitans sp.]|nr:hypothetical protein [Limnohabitans sp.]
MLSDIKWATLYNYSPRGTTYIAKLSQNLRQGVKSGLISRWQQLIINRVASYQDFKSFFTNVNENITIVPIPRSAKNQPNQVWPSCDIAQIIVQCINAIGLQAIIHPVLERSIAIRKSSNSFTRETRPTVDEHIRTLSIKNEIIYQSNDILLVDDIITQGVTAFACASKIHEKYPNSNIKVLALLNPDSNLSYDLDSDIYQFNIGIIEYKNGITIRKKLKC